MCSLTQVSMAVITFGAHWGRDQQHLSERERNKIMWLSTVQQLLISHRLECDYWCGTCRRSDDQSIGWSKKKISINKWGSHDAWQTGDKHAYCRTPCEIWGEDQALLRMRRGSLWRGLKQGELVEIRAVYLERKTVAVDQSWLLFAPFLAFQSLRVFFALFSCLLIPIYTCKQICICTCAG